MKQTAAWTVGEVPKTPRLKNRFSNIIACKYLII